MSRLWRQLWETYSPAQSASRRRRHESMRRSCSSGRVQNSPAWVQVCEFSFQVERDGKTASGHREAAAHRNTRGGSAGWIQLGVFTSFCAGVCAYQNLNARFKFRLRPPRVFILGLIWSNLRQPVVKTAIAMSSLHSFWHQSVFFFFSRRLQIRAWSHSWGTGPSKVSPWLTAVVVD